jgi:CelD/BcsL family acetyltransferase involved in cellulose biosynthesis
VAARFGAGEIQLLRLRAGGQREVGYLYNFVRRGVVHAYQSGFRYNPDPRLKPGLVSHALAIEHNLATGARLYEFMAGASRYKASLGTLSGEMAWLVLQRDRLALRAEAALRAAVRAGRSRFTRFKRFFIH